jgi:dolichol-phosphate mannosyltransferase
MLIKKVSIIIPCYNEKKTISKVIEILNRKIKIKKQIILVDDYSTDGTREIIRSQLNKKVDNIIFHSKNKGKGACIISAQKIISGDLVIIQDADLEYDPNDINKIINLFQKINSIRVIYGSRVLNKSNYNNLLPVQRFRVFANYLLTFLNNIFNSQNLTDAHTCYKVFVREVFCNIYLQEERFAFCSEVNTKLSKLGINIVEIPIAYKGREYNEGKKIKLIDAFDALKAIIKYNFFDKKYIELYYKKKASVLKNNKNCI